MGRTRRPSLRHLLGAARRDPVRAGQALVLGALMMTVLVAFTGLAVDTGVWLVAKARLQRAVDAAALSVILDRPITAQTDGAAATCPGSSPVATARSRTFILNQGIPAAQITCVLTDVPRTNQLAVTATQVVPTAFAKIIGVTQATITARATADMNTYIEVPVSPICGGAVGAGVGVVCDGGIGDSTMDQFGRTRDYTYGDAYTNPSSPYYTNPDGSTVLPNGYLYRTDVGPGYTGALDIQVWDPDGFNQSNPPQYLDPCGVSPCNTNPNPVYSALNDLRPSFPSVSRNYYANGYHLFWRIDECSGSCQNTAEMTPIQLTLWYLDPNALDPLNPLPGERTNIARVIFSPTAVTCTAPSAGVPCTNYVYTCTAPDGNNGTCPDMRWVRAFQIPDVGVWGARVDGSRSFFIDVTTIGNYNGENSYHLRSGPPPGDVDQAACQRSGRWSDGRPNWESVNNQVNCQWRNGRGSANTKIYARRSMVTNVVQAATGNIPYVVWLGYIPKTAAGQTLRLRNYDLDRPGGSCTPATASNGVFYTAFFPSDGHRTNLTINGQLYQCGSGNGTWQEDVWTVPPESDTAFWGGDQGFWLYTNIFQKTGSSPFWDTAVFEVIFNRARLIK